MLLAYAVVLSTSCASSGDSGTAASQTKEKEAVPVAELISKAEALYKERKDLEKVREGITLMKRARNADNKNYEANWKLAKFSYYLGRYSTDEKESEKALKDGIEAAETAYSIEREKPDGYFWKGACIGIRAKKNPLTIGLGSLAQIKEMMNKVIELDPTYMGGSAYDALAQIELGTRITGGKAEKALEYLDKAVAIESQNSFTRLRLAEAYLDLDRKEDAKKQIDFLLKMKPNPDFLPEYEESKELAEKLLKNRF
jgi:tetratricopeptide (TPR) repeat protein